MESEYPGSTDSSETWQWSDTLQDDPNPRSVQTKDLDLRNDYLHQEASCLMFYLDHGFSQQFPAYHPSPAQGGRSWLLPLLTSTKPAYYASICLAARFWRLNLEVGSEDSDEAAQLRGDEERYNMIAIRELRSSLGPGNADSHAMSLDVRVGVLACLMQLVFFESLKSRLGFWTAHMNAALHLIQELEVILGDRDGLCAFLSRRVSPLQSYMAPALKFLISVFCDWSAKSFYPLCLQYNLVPALQSALQSDQGISNHLECATGCRTWVILALNDTISLHQWSIEARSQNLLSVRELARRGNQIEVCLQEGIARDLDSQDLGQFLTDTRDPRQTEVCISHVMALTVRTCLYHIVEGFNSDLPMVRSCVKSVLNALREIRGMRDGRAIVSRLHWAIAVMGFITTDDRERTQIRCLLQDFSREASAVNGITCSTAFENLMLCMETVWYKKKNGGQDFSYDWIQALKTANSAILLI